MKVKFAQLLPASQGLARLMSVKMAPAAALWVSRMARLMQPEVTTFEQQLFALAQALGTPVEGKPNARMILEKDVPEYTRQAEELGLVEIELALTTFKFEDLRIAEPVAPEVFDALEFLLAPDTPAPAEGK